MRVGILALQGDFGLHQKMLMSIGCEVELVRDIETLNQCQGLIIPGGESTTILKLMHANGLFESIREFGTKFGIFGTCAGLILLSNKGSTLETLGLIDIEVERNAYGSQINSFQDSVTISMDHVNAEVQGVFIRAPKIKNLGRDVRAIGWYKNDVVAVENDHILATSFHPELTNDLRIHQYFVNGLLKRFF